MDQQRRTRRARTKGRRHRTRRQRGGAVASLKEWFVAVKADRASRLGKPYTLGDLKQPALNLPVPIAKTLSGGLKQLQASPEFTMEPYGDVRFFLLSVSDYPYFLALSKAQDLKNFTEADQSEDSAAQHNDLIEFEKALRSGAEDASADISLFDTVTYPHYLWYLYANTNIDDPDMAALRGLPMAEKFPITPSVLEE